MNIDFIIDQAKSVFPLTRVLRRHIHQNPELSFVEYKTAEFIRTKLAGFGIDFITMANTGTVAHIGTGDVCVALRADIDALPIIEETGLDFASLNPGVMHACGHDMHTSMLLAAAKILKDNESLLKGTVKLIFQPGEEKLPGGAKIMIDEGVLENPKPAAIFGQHIYPSKKSGTISVAGGPVFASTDELYWTVKGRGTHAAQPHLGSDAILASSQLINYYQTILTKFKNPLDSCVLSVTSIHGGSATNIFPEEVKMMGTLRTYNEVLRTEIHDILMNNSEKMAQLYGCSCLVDIVRGYPALINNHELAALVKEAAINTVGAQNTLDFEPIMWAEDFAYYSTKIPACFWMLGVRPENLSEMPPLHNSRLNPSEEAMINGTAMLVSSAINFLNNKNI